MSLRDAVSHSLRRDARELQSSDVKYPACRRHEAPAGYHPSRPPVTRRSGGLGEPLAREGVGQHAQLDPASMQLRPQLGGRHQEPPRRDVQSARGIEDDVHLPSEVIRGHQRPSEVLRGPQRYSEAFRGPQRSSEVIRGHQRYSEAFRAHQRSSRGTQGRLAALMMYTSW